MYRVSATVIEKFRRMLVAGDDNTWDTEQSLIDTITGKFEGNDKTRIGSAVHSIIENGVGVRFSDEEGRNWVLQDQLAIPAAAVQVALDYRMSHRAMHHEIPAGQFYTGGLTQFYISGRVDGLEGRIVRDMKTKFSGADAQGYLDSCQWKFYLDMLGLDMFYYDVFEIKGFSKDGLERYRGEWKTDRGVSLVYWLEDLRIQEPEEIACYSYPTMQLDLRELMNGFNEWLRDRNLYHLLSPCNADGSYTTPPTKGRRSGNPETITAETTQATGAS